MYQVIHEEPVVPRRAAAPGAAQDLETICLHCLHKESKKRYPTAGALAEDLEHYLAGAIKARPLPAWEKGLAPSAQHRPAAAALALLALALR